jgi:diguanylate cyclase (GGDEF)-like protein
MQDKRREKGEKTPPEGERLKHQLFRLLDHHTPSLDFVSAMAGDRELTLKERERFESLKERRGDKLYVDFLFALTHRYYPPEVAVGLWKEILEHKVNLSGTLKRNVGVAVAALDYLANVKSQLRAPTLISEPKFASIAEVAVRDGLTQLYDHSTFYAKLKTEIRRYKRYKTPVSLILIDIDDFKQFNDTHGHQEGDQVLVDLAALIKRATRDLDVAARYGGEEFAIILPQTGSEESALLAERLRIQVESSLGEDRRILISLGVATCPGDGKSAGALVKKADQALYRSKRRGKNRVTVYGRDEPAR